MGGREEKESEGMRQGRGGERRGGEEGGERKREGGITPH